MAQLNLAGIITRVVTDLKARFAAIAHNHAAGDITSGTLAIARGGTNAGTAAAARTNLDAAQDASSGTTLYAAQQAISGLAAAQGSVPSGKTLQGEISTLQDSVALAIKTLNVQASQQIESAWYSWSSAAQGPVIAFQTVDGTKYLVKVDLVS